MAEQRKWNNKWKKGKEITSARLTTFLSANLSLSPDFFPPLISPSRSCMYTVLPTRKPQIILPTKWNHDLIPFSVLEGIPCDLDLGAKHLGEIPILLLFRFPTFQSSSWTGYLFWPISRSHDGMLCSSWSGTCIFLFGEWMFYFQKFLFASWTLAHGPKS